MPSRSFWNVLVVILEKRIRGVSAASLARFAGRAQRAAGLRGRVSILVTGSAELRRLNRRYRRRDRATDVLAFPADGVRASRPHPHVAGDGGRASRPHPHVAGDIAISAEVAAENARRFGHSPAAEVKILILHGLLHLAGLDHERDRGQMSRREEKLRRRLGLPGSLLGRNSGRASRPHPHVAGDGGRASRPHPHRSRREGKARVARLHTT